MATKTLPGYKREAGTGRGYINTATGERLSRRQYEKLYERQHMTNERVTIQNRAQRNYNRLLSSYTAKAKAEGKSINKSEARKSAAMKQIVSDIKSQNDDRKKAALEASGLRQGVPSWVPVGMSDRYRRGALRRPSPQRRRNKG